jgi:hypothetical protein
LIFYNRYSLTRRSVEAKISGKKKEIVIVPYCINPHALSGSTKHENPPLPPFGKGGMGGFSYKPKRRLEEKI